MKTIRSVFAFVFFYMLWLIDLTGHWNERRPSKSSKSAGGYRPWMLPSADGALLRRTSLLDLDLLDDRFGRRRRRLGREVQFLGRFRAFRGRRRRHRRRLDRWRTRLGREVQFLGRFRLFEGRRRHRLDRWRTRLGWEVQLFGRFRLFGGRRRPGGRAQRLHLDDVQVDDVVLLRRPRRVVAQQRSHFLLQIRRTSVRRRRRRRAGVNRSFFGRPRRFRRQSFVFLGRSLRRRFRSTLWRCLLAGSATADGLPLFRRCRRRIAALVDDLWCRRRLHPILFRGVLQSEFQSETFLREKQKGTAILFTFWEGHGSEICRSSLATEDLFSMSHSTFIDSSMRTCFEDSRCLRRLRRLRRRLSASVSESEGELDEASESPESSEGSGRSGSSPSASESESSPESESTESESGVFVVSIWKKTSLSFFVLDFFFFFFFFFFLDSDFESESLPDDSDSESLPEDSESESLERFFFFLALFRLELAPESSLQESESEELLNDSESESEEDSLDLFFFFFFFFLFRFFFPQVSVDDESLSDNDDEDDDDDDERVRFFLVDFLARNAFFFVLGNVFLILLARPLTIFFNWVTALVFFFCSALGTATKARHSSPTA